jgi:hypothetical protein
MLAAQAPDPGDRARGWCLLGLCENALGHVGEAVTAFRHANAPDAAKFHGLRLMLRFVPGGSTFDPWPALHAASPPLHAGCVAVL